MYVSDGITYETYGDLEFIFDTLHLNKPQYLPIPPTFIKLSLAKIDAVLSKNRKEYAGTTGGVGSERDIFKYLDVKKQLEESNKEFMPFLICIQNNPLLLHVSSGRHRLAYLYEEGKQHVWCVIPEEQYGLFQAHFS